MKKEVPDFIVDEKTRVKKVKARARRDFFKKLAIALLRSFLPRFIFDLKQIGWR